MKQRKGDYRTERDWVVPIEYFPMPRLYWRDSREHRVTWTEPGDPNTWSAKA